jgi:hypothetical protein
MDKKKSRIPSFGGAYNSEESVLYDYYCYKELLGFDLDFCTKSISFDLNGCYKSSSDIHAEASFQIPRRGAVNLSIRTALSGKIAALLNCSLPKLTLPPINSASPGLLRSSLKLKVLPFDMRDIVTASVGVAADNYKGKMKMNLKKINGNLTVGSELFGGGAKTSFDVKKIAFGSYGIVGWFKEDLVKIVGLYEATLGGIATKRITGYFMYKTFADTDFVAKIKHDYLLKKTEILVGSEWKKEKGKGLKFKVSSFGTLSLCVYSKFLSRSKFRMSGEINLQNPLDSRFGVHYSFREKQSDPSNS